MADITKSIDILKDGLTMELQDIADTLIKTEEEDTYYLDKAHNINLIFNALHSAIDSYDDLVGKLLERIAELETEKFR